MGKFKLIIITVVGALLLLWGVNTIKLSKNGPGPVTVVSGSLTIQEGACDPDFNIQVNSPVLVRRVEMYQYYIDRNGRLNEDFYNSRVILDDADIKKYNKEHPLHRIEQNPSLPEDIGGSRTFIGKVTLGSNDCLLGERLLEKFTYGSYLYFDHQPAMLVVSGLKDMPSVGQYAPISDSIFAKTAGKSPEIGDVRIWWLCVDPEDLAENYTAVGMLTDGVLGDDKDYIDIMYDKVMSEEEVLEDFSGRNLKAGIGMCIAGGILAVLGVILLIRKRNE